MTSKKNNSFILGAPVTYKERVDPSILYTPKSFNNFKKDWESLLIYTGDSKNVLKLKDFISAINDIDRDAPDENKLFSNSDNIFPTLREYMLNSDLFIVIQEKFKDIEQYKIYFTKSGGNWFVLGFKLEPNYLKTLEDISALKQDNLDDLGSVTSPRRASKSTNRSTNRSVQQSQYQGTQVTQVIECMNVIFDSSLESQKIAYNGTIKILENNLLDKNNEIKLFIKQNDDFINKIMELTNLVSYKMMSEQKDLQLNDLKKQNEEQQKQLSNMSNYKVVSSEKDMQIEQLNKSLTTLTEERDQLKKQNEEHLNI